MDDQHQELPARADRTRRRFLATAVGSVAAAAAAAAVRPAEALAADGGNAVLGSTNTASATTTFNCNGAGTSALWGNATAGEGLNVGVRGDSLAGFGVWGLSSAGYGVWGEVGPSGAAGVVGKGGNVAVNGSTDRSNGTGVFGAGTWGVVGRGSARSGVVGSADAAGGFGVFGSNHSRGTGVAGYDRQVDETTPAKAMTGVYGESLGSTSSRGVWGHSDTGQGVRGEATSGIAVYGIASNIAGYAIRGSGRVRFDKVSGVASIPAGATSVTITPGVDVTTDSFLLLTPKSNIGTRSLYYSTDATNNRVTIRISSSRTSATSVAWLLLR